MESVSWDWLQNGIMPWQFVSHLFEFVAFCAASAILIFLTVVIVMFLYAMIKSAIVAASKNINTPDKLDE